MVCSQQVVHSIEDGPCRRHGDDTWKQTSVQGDRPLFRDELVKAVGNALELVWPRNKAGPHLQRSKSAFQK